MDSAEKLHGEVLSLDNSPDVYCQDRLALVSLVGWRDLGKRSKLP